MKITKRKLLKYLFLAVVSVMILFIWTSYAKEEEQETVTPRDYDEIVAEGIIRVNTEYNSTGFYIDGNDSLAGFHYELMEAFARDKNLQVKYIPEMSFDKRMKNLSQGKCDLIAQGMVATGELKDTLLLTVPIMLSKTVLVQRKANEDSTVYIKSLLDLGGKTIHLVKGSPTLLRVRNLEHEIGDTIYIKEVDKYGSEQLMAMVSYNDIDYAVCDEHVARALADSLPNLDIRTDVSFTQFYSWGAGKQSPQLIDTLNTWLINFRKGKKYQQIYRKYYRQDNLKKS